MRGASQNNNNQAGGTHVQGAIFAGSFPERAAARARAGVDLPGQRHQAAGHGRVLRPRSEEHTSELQSLMRISYVVFCLSKNTYVKQSARSIIVSDIALT